MYDIEENQTAARDPMRSTLATAASSKPTVRYQTGIPELDYVLGCDPGPGMPSGLVRGSVVALGGTRGTGKSTISMQALDFVTRGDKRAGFYCSGEQNADDVLGIARRLGIMNPSVQIRAEDEASNIARLTVELESFRPKPRLVVVDSVQTAYMADVDGDVGKATQIDAVTQWLTSFAKATKITFILICHLNKEGDLAGTEVFQHLVDVLIMLNPHPFFNDDGEIREESANVVEISILGKNRYGDKNASALLAASSAATPFMGQARTRR